jgi:hypothetical protein
MLGRQLLPEKCAGLTPQAAIIAGFAERCVLPWHDRPSQGVVNKVIKG